MNRSGRQENPFVRGVVRWDARKSLWFGSITVAAVVFAPGTFSWDAFAVFAGFTALTLCAGHSVGIHRGLIHRSFRTPRWLERALTYLGVLVGLGGPIGLLRLHQVRDTAQNQRECHDYFAHRRSLVVDYLWNLHCRFEFHVDPALPERADVTRDRFYVFLERTWRWHQLAVALALFALGGWSYVVWGVFVRIAVGTTGHWFVGHVCHRSGSRRWNNDGSAVQGFNSAVLGALSMGEGWHNNHHAFPRSARLGMAGWELDPGWWLIRVLGAAELATDVITPEQSAARAHRVSRVLTRPARGAGGHDVRRASRKDAAMPKRHCLAPPRPG